MTGDYDGDGKADLVVWRPADGNWFICSSTNNFDCTQNTIVQFGLPGDMPIKADFDGDGILDPSVFRPSDGNWFSRRSSDAQIQVIQWGLPGDIPMCRGVVDSRTTSALGRRIFQNVAKGGILRARPDGGPRPAI